LPTIKRLISKRLNAIWSLPVQFKRSHGVTPPDGGDIIVSTSDYRYYRMSNDIYDNRINEQ